MRVLGGATGKHPYSRLSAHHATLRHMNREGGIGAVGKEAGRGDNAFCRIGQQLKGEQRSHQAKHATNISHFRLPTHPAAA